jgi:hypothetical protein
MIAVIAVAVNAAAKLVPGVGESRISNKVGSGSAKVAARRLLNQVCIPSNSTLYANVEFVPTSDDSEDYLSIPPMFPL